MGYLLLLFAIIAETIGTTALKASNGFSHVGMSALSVTGYITGLIFFLWL